MEYGQQLKRVIEVVDKLRDPDGGCPWDLKQTHKSLLKYLIEESYEFTDAVESEDYGEMQSELGDILLQVLLHSKIAQQDGKFNLEDVCKSLADKLIFRHPHVFGDLKIKDEEEVKENWEKLKAQEKSSNNKSSKINADIDPHFKRLPALLGSYKIGKQTSSSKFDWENHMQVIYKVEEEWQELKEELNPTGSFNPERVEEELGDLLFSVSQLSRHLKIVPEDALRKANIKFMKRYEKMMNLADERNENFQELDQSQKEEYWNQVKKEEL